MLFRRRGWRPAGAVVAAMIFILGGSASARLQHTGMILSYACFPLALWLLEEALARRSYACAAAFAAVAALMTVGRDQVAFLCALALIGVVIHETVTAERALAYLRERLGVLLAMGRSGRCCWPCRRSSPCSSSRPRRGPPSASASRPWARFHPRASPRSCSATCSAHFARPTTTGTGLHLAG
jgi:hypothetical protein